MIEMEILENLFKLSNFEFNQQQASQWQKDISQWLTFFSLENAPISNDGSYQFAGTRLVEQLRLDDQVQPSLSHTDIKLYCKRFVDGFVALPEHNKK